MFREKKSQMFTLPSLFFIVRVLFGVGWLLAGVTKITNKSWFAEPGQFLTDYLLHSLHKENVPEFYKYFIENIALENVMFFNYAIPIVQLAVGTCIVLGFLTIPSILICLFLHINFILSGNMNGISLVLYTSAFCLLIGRKYIYLFTLDRYLGIHKIFISSDDLNHSSAPIERSGEKYRKKQPV